MLTEVTAALAALASLGTGINLVVNLRGQRDMAQLENKILAAINSKYLSRKEAEILQHAQEKLDLAVKEKFNVLDDRIGESRHLHHDLHEEFIACRASHELKEI